MNRPYKTYAEFLREFFPFKVQKLSIDIASTCPNRDGTKGYGGCIYCLNEAFSPYFDKRGHKISQQIEQGKNFFRKKYPEMKYLAYFQSYTPTYPDSQRFLTYCHDALKCEDVVGVLVSTRPDCISSDLLDGLKKIKNEEKIPVFFELGVETSHDETLKLINRNHSWADTFNAIQILHGSQFSVGIHLILGLPGEDTEKMVETISRVNTLPVSTIKFHQLQVLKGTRLEKQLSEGTLQYHSYSPKEYAHLCAQIISILRKDIAIERFIAQAPLNYLIAPKWGLKKHEFDLLLSESLEAIL